MADTSDEGTGSTSSPLRNRIKRSHGSTTIFALRLKACNTFDEVRANQLLCWLNFQYAALAVRNPLVKLPFSPFMAAATQGAVVTRRGTDTGNAMAVLFSLGSARRWREEGVLLTLSPFPDENHSPPILPITHFRRK